jgi:O-antigen/teichoic acid export membrane protein
MNSMQSLKRRSLTAAAWAGGNHALGQALRLGGNLVLTRLLMPEAFGIMSVVAVLMMALYQLSDIGTGVSIVQSPRGEERAFVHTAWTVQVIQGVVLWVIAVAIAGAIAFAQGRQWFSAGTAFADPRLPLLWVVASFTTVINGFVSINTRIAERQLALKRLFVLDTVGQLITLCVMVLGAYYTGSVWALVVGGLVGSLVRCALSHTALPGEPMGFRLERSALHEQAFKGKGVFLSTSLAFLAVNGDRFLVGSSLDTATMGFYSIALGLAGISTATINAVYFKTVFPSLSEVVRTDPARVGRVYRKFQAVADLAIGGMAGLFFMLADPIVGLLYDDRYRMAGYIFGALCIGSIGERARVIDQIFLANGKPMLVAYSMVPRVVVLFAGIPLGHAYGGLDGVLVAVVLSQFASWPVSHWYRARLGIRGMGAWDLLFIPALSIGLLVGWGLAILAGAR